ATAVAVDPGPSAEDGLVDPAGHLWRTQLGRGVQEYDRPEPAGSRASDRQYLTDTDYVVPMRSRMMNQQELGHRVLTLIAVTLIIVGSVFCYKYSAALRAADENDPGGRQPIVFGSQGSAFSGVSGGGAVAGDTKLAVHAQKSYYQRQKQNIASAFKPKSGPSKSPIQEADSDQEDSNIYGCPGLASTSGLEVSNPIFAGPDSDEE
uniref:Neural proliferation differentiation and control protein 1 n=1 Tax=Macrostomum lignano TaxID=282301 RepID=A0A1I8F6E8_9PLAT